MSYSILRVARVKGSSNTKGIQRHNQRENENYNNKDINHAETYKNYDLINAQNIDYQQVIDETINANYTGNRKIRSDAIRHVDGLITSDKEFFDKMSDEDINRFFKDSLTFLEDEYGKENMLYATVHLDEKVPHMHFGFVPLTDDGRLSAKEKVGNKKALTELQDRFNLYVNERGYELERGTSKQVTEKEHKDMDRYKKETEYHKKELQEVRTELEGLKAQLDTDIELLRDKINIAFEDEKHVEKNIFGKVTDERVTGRKILDNEDFEQLQKRVSSAERILDDYEEIKGKDLYRENEQLKARNSELFDKSLKFGELAEKFKEERNELDGFLGKYQRFTEGLYKHLREHFNGFEKVYDDFKDKLYQNDKTKVYGQFMGFIQDNVHEQDKSKRRGQDLEL